ncbi:MAG: oxidoreductase coenzyme F420-dependent [Streptosporangiaceae bacterium]|nr:oxidoreductase coenzyme F420-dependent [Streptosporangiaceae bacterium]
MPAGGARPEDRPGRLSVGVIGAGRVGTALGAALSLAGHRVVAASAVSEESRHRAALRLPGVVLATPQEVVEAADLVLLTVPDEALPQLVSGLVATEVPVAGTLLVHSSGRYGFGVLNEATRAGALPMAIHPVMTFTGRPEDVNRLAGISFGVTAPDALRPVAEALVVEMGGEPVWIPEDKRALYHAALAGGANHLVTLVVESMDLLGAAGVEDPGRMLGPLLGAALDNALRLGMNGLTGPVARGDAATVADHIAELARVSPAGRRAYIALARLTADRALAAGLLKPADAERLLEALAD